MASRPNPSIGIGGRLPSHPRSAAAVPRAPRRVPLSAALGEVLLPLATGISWLVIGILALAVGRLEGLPVPERATRGSGIAWLIGIGLFVAGGVLVSWALVRALWWSRLQRYGRAVDATVTRAERVDWFRIAGREPVDLELSYRDATGHSHSCRLRAQRPLRGSPLSEGQSVVLVHSENRPEIATLYWDRRP